MARFLFQFKKACKGIGYEVHQRSLALAQRDLLIFWAAGDPYGDHMNIRHIELNFRLIDSAERIIDVTSSLLERGLVDPEAAK